MRDQDHAAKKPVLTCQVEEPGAVLVVLLRLRLQLGLLGDGVFDGLRRKDGDVIGVHADFTVGVL